MTPRTAARPIVDANTSKVRVVPFLFQGEHFTARGVGSVEQVVCRSIARRVDGSSVTLWQGDERGTWRAQWYDDVREVFCEETIACTLAT